MKLVKQITTREGMSLDRYLTDISKVDLLTPDEEIRLAQQIKKGNKKALDKLVRANLRFVVSVAKQYQNQGMPLTDLISEGNIGLMKAAERFDETRGFKFISYAVWWVRQSILQALAEQSRIVRLPMNKIGTLNKINKAFNSLEQEYEREPSTNELAKKLELDASEIKNTMKFSRRNVSIDAPFSDDNKNNLLKVLPNKNFDTPDSQLMKASLIKELEKTFSTLTDKEADVIKLYFGIGKTNSMNLEEIGETYNLTRERVRQIKEKALRKLRRVSRSNNLRAYLG